MVDRQFGVSGALLLGKEENLWVFAKKRLQKVFIPLVVWTPVYFIFNAAYYSNPYSLDIFFKKVLTAKVAFHLWYLYVALAIYSFVPLFRRWIKHTPIGRVQNVLIAWFVSLSVVWLLGLRAQVEPATERIIQLLGYMGYFTLGYVLKTADLKRTSVNVLCVVLFFSGFAVTSIGTYYVTAIVHDGRFDHTFYEHFSPNVIVMSAGLFVLVKNTVEFTENSYLCNLAHLVANASLGMYLVHVMVLAGLRNGHFGIAVNEYVIHPAVGIPLTALSCSLLSLGITMILRRVPILRASVA